MTINFGIDLGTTNSLIAKFEEGEVSVYPTNDTGKESMPSAVAFKDGQKLVGGKALDYLHISPEKVASGFKRKMGTSDRYMFPGLTEALSPVELSSYILQELKFLVRDQEKPQAAVITIPAAFDTNQAKATLEAGSMAGFEQVVLLQEPIAASLAFANQNSELDFTDGKWLVYDLGGGTFDAAIVEVVDDEMRVKDHAGDNYLGGTDLDRAIVLEKLLPFIEEKGSFSNLLHEMQSSKGKYNGLYLSLLKKAEIAKIELSQEEQVEIEFEVVDESGKNHTLNYALSKIELEQLSQTIIDRTVSLVQEMLKRNQLKSDELSFILLVGGFTHMPYLQAELEQQLSININRSVNPDTAVAIGAAYFAGTQSLKTTSSTKKQASIPFEIKFGYQKTSQDEEEFLAIRCSSQPDGYFYRIRRKDGGYDSGYRKLKEKISIELPLAEDEFNQFEFTLHGPDQALVDMDFPIIAIHQGRFRIQGQPLPHDICIEIDDIENKMTGLEVIFNKNAILPLKKTLIKQVNRTISKASKDALIINVLEGPSNVLPAANQPIGYISISGNDLERDLIKGSDVEITLEMSESRDLNISAYLLMTDQEFNSVFVNEDRHISIDRLLMELSMMLRTIKSEILEAEQQANFELAQSLVDIEYEIVALLDETDNLPLDDAGDIKFSISSRKREIAQKVDELTRDKVVNKVKNKYFQSKRILEFVINHYGANEAERTSFRKILEDEKTYLGSNSTLKIQHIIDQFNELNAKIVWRSPTYLIELFKEISQEHRGKFSRPDLARPIIDRGYQAIDEQSYNDLRRCINQLWDLLPKSARENQTPFKDGTGLS